MHKKKLQKKKWNEMAIYKFRDDKSGEVLEANN